MPTRSSSHSSRRRRRDLRREPREGTGRHILLGAGWTWRCVAIATPYGQLASGNVDRHPHTPKATGARRVRWHVADAVAASNVARDLGKRVDGFDITPWEIRQTASDLRERAQDVGIGAGAVPAVVGRHAVDDHVAPDGTFVHLLLRVPACIVLA